MNQDEIKKLWEDFTQGKDFMLNPEGKMVDMLAAGVLKNEAGKGFRFCPCRISDGTREKEIDLLCPCNFKTHTTWASKGRCWCGLFVKRMKA